MANFTKSFTDFSYGEIDPENTVVAANAQQDRGGALMDNVHLSDTRGFERRTGTLKIANPNFTPDPNNENVVVKSFFVGKGLSFVCMMYVVDTSRFSEAGLISSGLPDTTQGIDIPEDSLVLCFDWYKSEGFEDTYLQTTTLCVDADNPVSPSDYSDSVRVRDNAWTDLYGFDTASFQNLLVFTHSSGSIMPFVFYYTKDESTEVEEIKWFEHNNGLNITRKEYWTDLSSSNAFSRPFEQANLNPRTSLRFDISNIAYIGGDRDVFFDVSPCYYDSDADEWELWTSGDYARDVTETPLGVRTDFIKINYLNHTYVLEYQGSYTAPDSFTPVQDMRAYATHVYRVVAGSESPNDLGSVVSDTPKYITDFSEESFSADKGFPENCVFYDQRLVFVKNGVYYNSAVGNAFFFNQYRFIQDTIAGVYITSDSGSNLLETSSSNLLVDYSGDKIASDPFDMTPLSDVITDTSWMNKGDGIEVGTYSEINIISGISDSVYAFNSVKSEFKGAYGSKKHISLKAGNDTIFIDSSNKSLRNYYYSGQARTTTSNNLNDLNKDMIEELSDEFSIPSDSIEISEVSYDDTNETIYVLVTPNNKLFSCVYDRGSSKISWSRVNIGGDGTYSVDVRSTACLRNDKSDSYTYIVTKRGNEFWLEKFSKRYEHKNYNPFQVYGNTVEVSDYPYMLDFATGFKGSSSTWNIGTDYADTTVSALADGYWISDIEVDSSGNITLDRVVRTLVVGYPYKSRFRTLDVEPLFGGETGNALHHIKSINYVHLRLVKSYAGMICAGEDLTRLEDIPYQNDTMIPDDDLLLFTGAVDVHLTQEASPRNSVYIETDAPYPLRVEALLVKGESNER